MPINYNKSSQHIKLKMLFRTHENLAEASTTPFHTVLRSTSRKKQNHNELH
ncbi:hypothetical protein HanRHA438_Chr08g0371441 [Helianthus annuus]|nr:hypothetical protein HanRHA438_Chr08g0371441 [Helianthus annuus]